MVNFWSSVFVLPKTFYSKVDALCSAFLWRNKSAVSPGARVAWSDVCKPKEEGGLGIRSLVDFASVFRLKHVWKLFTSKDSLWVAWLRENVFGKKDYWEAKQTSKHSKHVRSLLQVKPLLSHFMKCELGNGRKASFWHDTWSDLGPLLAFMGSPGPRQLRIRLHGRVCEAVVDGHWRIPPARSQTSLDLQAKLTTITPPSDEEGEDIFLWRSATGEYVDEFSSRATWSYLRSQSPGVAWHEAVWFKNSIPRCSFMSWLAIRQRLPTRDRLIRWGMLVSDQCVLCSNATESHDHLFFTCPYSLEIWLHFTRSIRPPPPAEANQATLWTTRTQRKLAIPSSCLNYLTKLMMQVTIYVIWKERNARIFRNTTSPAIMVRHMADRMIRDRLLSLPKQSSSAPPLLLYYFHCIGS